MIPPPTRRMSGAGTSANVRVDLDAQVVDVVVDGAGAVGAEHDVDAGEVGEHLVGADDVEGGEAVVEADGELHGQALLLKWRRYWSGVVPTRRAKARWRVSGPPKPVAAATVATGAEDVSSRRRADSTRSAST